MLLPRLPCRGAAAVVFTRLWRTGLALALCAPAMAWGQNSKDAEKKLEQLRGEIRSVSQERRQLEGQRGTAGQALRTADQKVAQSGRALADAEQAIGREQAALTTLQARKAQLQRGASAQRAQLSALLQSAYRQGRHGPLKSLLSHDRVSEAQRQLTYQRYLQREHSAQLATLTADLRALEQTEAEITQRQRQLQQVREQHRQQAAQLRDEREKRARLLTELDRQYQDRSEREKALGQDARALERVLANLRAAAAKAEAERRAAAKRAAQQAAAAARNGTTTPRPARTPARPVASAPAPRVGGLGWPVSGSLLARYGARLPDGRSSSGLLIGAAAGTTVTAVAEGNVVFSDWMTGYGMILIVDHGNGYMSLYAHNDALLKDVGAKVRRGDAVAKVGSSGGQGVSALYFELRRNGQPVDPATWLQRQ